MLSLSYVQVKNLRKRIPETIRTDCITEEDLIQGPRFRLGELPTDFTDKLEAYGRQKKRDCTQLRTDILNAIDLFLDS